GRNPIEIGSTDSRKKTQGPILKDRSVAGSAEGIWWVPSPGGPSNGLQEQGMEFRVHRFGKRAEKRDTIHPG
ncbi:MAG: hypothetical protein PVJ76_16510, partial [Gemmatimonadota bacterium]